MLTSELDPVTTARVQMLLRSGYRLSVQLDGESWCNGHGGMGYVATFSRTERDCFSHEQRYRSFDGAGATWNEAIENAAWQVN